MKFVLALLRRFFDAVSTIVLVTAIAALGWLFAEQQNVHDQSPIDIQLEYGTADEQTDFLISHADAPQKVRVSFHSSNSDAEKVRAKLQSTGPFHVKLNLNPNSDDAQSLQVDIKQKIQEALTTGNNRLAVSNIKTDPDLPIALTAEKFLPVTLPLKMEYDRLQLVGVPKKDAETVTVMMTKSMDNLRGSTASLSLNELNLGDAKAGDEITRQVPVEIPALTYYLQNKNTPLGHRAYYLKHPRITPESVKVTLVLDKASSEFSLKRSVPVSIAVLPGFEKWSFEFVDQDDKFLKALRLTGSPEARKRVEESEQPGQPKLIWAVARVVSEIPADGILMLNVDVTTPPGVTLAPGTLLKQVKVRATRRDL